MALRHANDANFNDTISNGLTLVDFWAPWCGPCRVTGKTLEELSDEIDNVKFGKVNADEEEDLSDKYMIQSLPTIMVFKNGVQVGDKLIGAQGKPRIKENILKNIG